jgi:hypothetical protein
MSREYHSFGWFRSLRFLAVLGVFIWFIGFIEFQKRTLSPQFMLPIEWKVLLLGPENPGITLSEQQHPFPHLNSSQDNHARVDVGDAKMGWLQEAKYRPTISGYLRFFLVKDDGTLLI